MAYTVREVTDLAAFDQLVAFQEHSADEVGHRRERAGFAMDVHAARAPGENRKSLRKSPPQLS